jgi:F-type H+-transporting ATPase subunit a
MGFKKLQSFFIIFLICIAKVAMSQDHTTAEDTIHHNQSTAQVHSDGNTEPSHDSGHEAGSGELDFKELIFGHTSDSHYWHLWGHTSVPLPVILWNKGKLSLFSSGRFNHGHDEYNGFKIEKDIKEKIVATDGSPVYDFSLTKNTSVLFLAAGILILLLSAAGKKAKNNGSSKAPSGVQNVIEPIVTFIRDNVAKPNLGNKYATYMPMLLTIFFLIWILNLIGLLPFGFNVTGNIAFTLALATIYFVVFLAKANKHFWAHTFNPHVSPFPVKVIIVLIEFLSIFIKPVALAIRLFANMFAGHTILVCVISLMFVFKNLFGAGVGYGFSPISVGFSLFMMLLEVLVTAIQAFIFTNLASLFIGLAIEEPQHETAHH